MNVSSSPSVLRGKTKRGAGVHDRRRCSSCPVEDALALGSSQRSDVLLQQLPRYPERELLLQFAAACAQHLDAKSAGRLEGRRQQRGLADPRQAPPPAA